MNNKCTTCGHLHRSDNDTKICTLLECMCDITKFQPQLETKSISHYQQILESYDNIYDKVKYLLEEIPAFRNLTNKELVFSFWHYHFGWTPGMILDIPTYSKLTDPESILRCKRKVVENHSELGADEKTLNKKYEKQLAIMDWVIQ